MYHIIFKCLFSDLCQRSTFPFDCVQGGKEKYPKARPRIISDNGPQFIAKDFDRVTDVTFNPDSPSIGQKFTCGLHDSGSSAVSRSPVKWVRMLQDSNQ
jgi:hypothetical protein